MYLTITEVLKQLQIAKASKANVFAMAVFFDTEYEDVYDMDNDYDFEPSVELTDSWVKYAVDTEDALVRSLKGHRLTLTANDHVLGTEKEGHFFAFASRAVRDHIFTLYSAS